MKNETNALKGKGLVFDGKSQYVKFPSDGFPMGNTARTLEFWMRAVPCTDGTPHYIVNWGEPNAERSTFGVYARYMQNKYSLCFWSHYGDIEPIATLPDDQWHFVVLTYDSSTLRFFLDSELKLEQTISLDTKPGDMFVGSRKGSTYFFEGVVRDIAIWNYARNLNQIQMDMASWPTLSGNETGLVTCLPFNEGTGNTFSDIQDTIYGTINSKATWSKPIAANPDPIDEGIWFVIQNKADLDSDTEMSARRMAMCFDGKYVAWKPIPLAGNYDEFLWRTVLKNDRHHLINKKTGTNKALDTYGGKRYTFLNNIENNGGQMWNIQLADLDNWGTNVYTLSNDFVTTNEALSLEGNDIRFVPKKEDYRNQAWVLQPMELAMGYHIPVSDRQAFPMSQEVEIANGCKVNATVTTTEWAVLTGHLIWKNMLNNLTDILKEKKALNAVEGSWRQIMMISRFDQNGFAYNYPLMYVDRWDERELKKLRGGVRLQTLVSEELMCRIGVFSNGHNDKTYREFDQVIHEFGHALDNLSQGQIQSNFPLPLLNDIQAEAQACAVQSWYNNNYSYSNRARTRTDLKTKQPEQHGRLAEFFRKSNDWMPPRWLRDQLDGKMELKYG